MLINKHSNDLKYSKICAAVASIASSSTNTTTTDYPTRKNNIDSSSMNKCKINQPTPTMTTTNSTPSKTLDWIREQQRQQQQRHYQKSTPPKFATSTSSAAPSSTTMSSFMSSLFPSPLLQLQRKFLIGFILTILYIQHGHCADLAISIPNNQGMDGAYYRLDYSPPYGYPEPNATIASNEIGNEIQFSRALPGTKYNFWLYYTNSTHLDWLTWTVSITTAPDPPSNLSVQVRSSKNAIIQWSPPTQGNYTAFKIKVVGLSEASSSYNRVFNVNDTTFQHSAKELTPGATYQVQAYTIYDGKESVAYTSRNFTTSKSRKDNQDDTTKRPNKCSFK